MFTDVTVLTFVRLKMSTPSASAKANPRRNPDPTPRDEAGLACREIAGGHQHFDQRLLTSDALGGRDDLERKRERTTSFHAGAEPIQMAKQALPDIVAFTNI